MGKVLIPILIGVATSISMILFNLISHFNFSRLVNYIKSLVLPKAEPDRGIDSCSELDMSILNCRVQLTKQQNNDTFNVQICGSIHAPDNVHSATLRISIMDITESVSRAKPVQSLVKQWQVPESSEFCYNAELGKLPHQVTAISNWTSIAQLRLDWLVLARKGKRNLLFETSILSTEDGERLACARSTVTYDNPAFGYIDLQENIQRKKTLAVALAFAVSAEANKIYDCEIKLIKDWARDNINLSKTPGKARRKLKKALNETVAFFRDGNQLDIYDTCREIVEIAPLADRYEILNLCLHVAQANGFVTCEELAVLKEIASRLEINEDKFRAMMQKVVPVNMHEVKNVETILGVTSDMSKEKARRHLNREYGKWSARVTNPDPEIQNQADQMLKLIAETRGQYMG